MPYLKIFFHCFLNIKVASRSPKALEADFQKDAVPIITSATHLVVQKAMKYFHATELLVMKHETKPNNCLKTMSHLPLRFIVGSLDSGR